MNHHSQSQTSLKCSQCNLAAMYTTPEGFPLCLHCFSLFSQITANQIEQEERMLNFYVDQIEAISGMPGIPRLPRFPDRAKPVNIIAGTKMTNIHLSNSVAGVINLGAIHSVDQTVSALITLGEPDLANAIKELTQATASSSVLAQAQKNELIEILGFLAEQAATPPQSRKSGMVASMLEKAPAILALANDVADTYQKYWPIIEAVFSKL